MEEVLGNSINKNQNGLQQSKKMKNNPPSPVEAVDELIAQQI